MERILNVGRLPVPIFSAQLCRFAGPGRKAKVVFCVLAEEFPSITNFLVCNLPHSGCHMCLNARNLAQSQNSCGVVLVTSICAKGNKR